MMEGVGNRTIVVTRVCPSSMRRREVWRIDQFHLMKKIGSGYASTVYLASCRTSGLQVAIKLYHKNKLSELNYYQVSREIGIHSSLDHNNIIQLWAAFEDQYGIYLVSEYASKGDVFADVEKRGGQMTEVETVRQVVHPFLLALAYLHDLKIMHRDIKPENLLFTSTNVLKVADFGLSINFEVERPVTRVGTLDYMAPEVVVCPDKHKPSDNKEMKNLYYTPVVDAWAVGVLAYELIVGRPPFDKGQKKLTIAEIINGEPEIPLTVSEGAASFIKWALTKDKFSRPTVQQLITHPWVAIHMQQPKPKVPPSLRILTRTDSYTEPRMFAPPEISGGESGSGNGPEEEVRSLQVRAVQLGGRLIGQSNSLSAVDFLRWRDIAFNANPEDLYGDPAAAAIAAVAASAVKRKSDGHENPLDGRSPSLATGSRLILSSGAPRTPTPGSPLHSRSNSLLLNGDLTGAVSKPMTREELFANLQASAVKLSRSGSFNNSISNSPRHQQLQQQQQQVQRPGSPSPPSSSSLLGHSQLTSRPASPAGSSSSPQTTIMMTSLVKRSLSSSLAKVPSSQNLAIERQGSSNGTSPKQLSPTTSMLLPTDQELYGGTNPGSSESQMQQLPSPSSAAAALKGPGSNSFRKHDQYMRSVTTPFSPSRLSTSFTTASLSPGSQHGSAGGVSAGKLASPLAARSLWPVPRAAPQPPLLSSSPRSTSLTRASHAIHEPPAIAIMEEEAVLLRPLPLGPAGNVEKQMESLMLDPPSSPSKSPTRSGILNGIKKVFG
ncbi:hypothetical protein CEUSTIGMA_g1465.t1 [Chlamydomonas eustigma]|uniref:Protein kinase domain-containing protein n=1 Tax=Chlamydomonas eustigma TaxID=1157962 RepID=A0A250WT77_9CHLO|nr:hypothetical protein CEUSTIGMA_g1465.t1 [Chlamydomonas eustigma]|eukprot:GAX74015.1 hypothetical protein CEUSTIGMA_g1465.t1 [Chlamydomonas eustigma]